MCLTRSFPSETFLKEIKSMKEEKPKILGITHNGKFHADEVFTTAFLILAFKEYNFVWKRVSQVPYGYSDDSENVIIYDIGGGKFDHHDEKCPKRPDGTKYAAFGLVFRQYGQKLLGDNFELFDKKFVQPIDLTDNYGQERYPNPLSSYIASLNPLFDTDKESSDGQFEKAVEIAIEILKREFLSIVSKNNSDVFIRESIEKSDGEVLILSKYARWQNVVVKESDAKFVIFPSPRQGYNLQTVPTSFKTSSKSQRVPFPEDWFDKKAKNGKKNSDYIKEQFPGIIFWNRSFACFDTLENAKEAAYRLIGIEQSSDNLGNMITPVTEWDN